MNINKVLDYDKRRLFVNLAFKIVKYEHTYNKLSNNTLQAIALLKNGHKETVRIALPTKSGKVGCERYKLLISHDRLHCNFKNTSGKILLDNMEQYGHQNHKQDHKK